LEAASWKKECCKDGNGSDSRDGQMLAEFLKSASAVAEDVFHTFAKFREGSGETVGNKEGVVAKTAGAGRLEGDEAGAGGFEEDGLGGELRIADCGLRIERGFGVNGHFGRWQGKGAKGQDTAETGGATGGRNAFEEAEEFGVVDAVRGVAGEAGVERGETGGVDSGRAVKGVHFEAGIVGEDVKVGKSSFGSIPTSRGPAVEDWQSAP
jgi:hypothetical protein